MSRRACHPLLEGGAADVQGQVEAERRRFDEADDLGHQALEVRVAADQLGLGELVLQVAYQGIGVVAQEDGADPALALRDEDGAQRALGHGEVDRGAGAAIAVFAGAHAEQLVGGFVEAAVGVEAGAVDGIGHRGADIAELAAQAAGAVAET